VRIVSSNLSAHSITRLRNPAVEAVLECNRRRREKYGPADADARSEFDSAAFDDQPIDAPANVTVELDVYRTILYLAKYQCTTAFHAFFPSTVKPCKGYHFWCAIGTPIPMFDRLVRDAIERINNGSNSSSRQANGNDRPNSAPSVLAPTIHGVSEVAVGFRCVFGHLI